MGHVPRFLASPFSVKYYALNWFDCLIVCPFWAKSSKYYSKKRGKLMQLSKERKDSNCIGILSDQGEAATASTSVNIL